ncbi:MAG TPA: PorV/PorQ family protein [Ignavibacteriaceae bacterium]|nr:PorV/PorQ family protein [Ignavibacteriaceae bacterium]
MKKLNIITFVAIFAAFTGLIYAGGGNRVGTAGSTQLLIPVGPRGIAMGSTTLTDSRGIEAIFWNPANLSLSPGAAVMFSHMNYIADIGVEYGAISVNTGSFGSIGFAIKSLAIDDIQVTTVENPDGTGEFYKPQIITTGLTWSLQISDRIAIGLTGNLNLEKLALVSKSNVSFNAGISYRDLGNINGLSFGLVLKNIGPSSSYSGSGLSVSTQEIPGYARTGVSYYTIDASSEDLPTTLELGVGYKYSVDDVNSLRLDGIFQNSNYYYDEYRVGLEYNYNDLVFVRGGYILTPEIDDKYAKENTLSAGFGLKFGLSESFNVKLDYAFLARELFDDTHVFGLTIEF